MKTPIQSSDPDIRGSWQALNRAARKAREIAKATGTPLYVLRKGRVVNANTAKRRSRS